MSVKVSQNIIKKKNEFQTGDFVMYRMKEAAIVESVCDPGLGFNNYNITFLSDGSKLMTGITSSK